MGEEAGRACPLTMGRPGDCPGALWSPATNGEPEAEAHRAFQNGKVRLEEQRCR